MSAPGTVSSGMPQAQCSNNKMGTSTLNQNTVAPGSNNNNRPGRKLITWTTEKNEHLIIAMDHVAKEHGFKIPMDHVANLIQDGASGGAIEQHIMKIRNHRIEMGLRTHPHTKTKRKRVEPKPLAQPKQKIVKQGARRTKRRNRQSPVFQGPDPDAASDPDGEFGVKGPRVKKGRGKRVKTETPSPEIDLEEFEDVEEYGEASNGHAIGEEGQFVQGGVSSQPTGLDDVQYTAQLTGGAQTAISQYNDGYAFGQHIGHLPITHEQHQAWSMANDHMGGGTAAWANNAALGYNAVTTSSFSHDGQYMQQSSPAVLQYSAYDPNGYPMVPTSSHSSFGSTSTLYHPEPTIATGMPNPTMGNARAYDMGYSNDEGGDFAACPVNAGEQYLENSLSENFGANILG